MTTENLGNIFPGPWIGGKVRSKPSISSSAKYYIGKIKVNGKCYTRCFYWEKPKSKRNFDTKEIAYSQCEKWIRERCEEENVIKNRYRHIDENRVEVELTQGKTMLIDKDNLPYLDKAIWSAHKAGGSRDISYCQTRVYNGESGTWLFHRIITNYIVVDHIDGQIKCFLFKINIGNGLNNVKSNLRDGSGGVNENNCFMYRNNTSGENGLSWIEKLKRWSLHWMENGERKSKYFPLSKYETKENAKIAAIEFRDEVYQRIGNNNGKRRRLE